MRPAAIWREIRRDLASGTARALLWAVAFAVVAGGLAVVDLLEIRGVLERARAFQEVGGSVTVLSAPDLVDGAACAALNEVEGVRAAGATRLETHRLALSLLPSAPVPVSSVTPGFVDVLRVKSDGGVGVILSNEVTGDLGVSAGDAVDTPDGPVRVSGVYEYPSDGRTPGYGYMALVPVPVAVIDDTPFDECWVDAWPSSDALRSLMYMAVLPSGEIAGLGDQPSMAQLNTTLGVSFDAQAAFSGRTTGWAPVAACVAGLLIGFLSVRLRKLEIASALHEGV